MSSRTATGRRGTGSEASLSSRLVGNYVQQLHVAKNGTRLVKGMGRIGRIFHGKSYILLHIGKTGGTSLAHAVDTARQSSENRSGPVTPIKLTHKASRLALEDPNLVHSEFGFVFRDPIERYVSAFYETLRQGRPQRSLGSMPWSAAVSAAYRWFEEPNDLFEALSSKNDRILSAAVTAFHEIPLLRMDHVWTLGSRQEFEKHARRIYFMCPLRHLDARFESLLFPQGNRTRINQGLALPLLRSVPGSYATVSETAENNLRTYRRAEFELVDHLERIYAERFC
jgi:hypothetical protein